MARPVSGIVRKRPHISDRPGCFDVTAYSLFHADTAAPATGPRLAARDPGKREDGDRGGGAGTAVITRTKPATKKPSMYRVLLLNDDYTTMEFVTVVLQKYFSKTMDEATRIMWHIHKHGVGECGVFTFEVAETKVTQVMDFARKHQHPLQCIMEKNDK